MSGVLYSGGFPLSLLADGEFVQASGDHDGACVVHTMQGTVRVELGDIVARTADGRLRVWRGWSERTGHPRKNRR